MSASRSSSTLAGPSPTDDPEFQRLVGVVVLIASSFEHILYIVHLMSTGPVRTAADVAAGWESHHDYSVRRSRRDLRRDMADSWAEA